jgi:PTS system nitrogen regulatory IIA component
MDIKRLLAPDRVICMSDISSKKRLLEKLSALLGLGTTNQDNGDIFNRLIERERLGTTGLGQGVALPHGRIDNLDQAIGAFIKLDHGVDFDSIDRKPADLIFALLVPEKHTEEHLQILAALAGMFSNPAFRDDLRTCHTDDEVFHHLTDWSQPTSKAG